MTKIDFIKKEDRYFLKICYMEDFIGELYNGNIILRKPNNEKLYDDLIDKIKNIYLIKNDIVYTISSYIEGLLFYNISESDMAELTLGYGGFDSMFIKIEVDKKDFTKLKLKYS